MIDDEQSPEYVSTLVAIAIKKKKDKSHTITSCMWWRRQPPPPRGLVTLEFDSQTDLKLFRVTCRVLPLQVSVPLRRPELKDLKGSRPTETHI